ncbi:MAG: NAD(P)H-hydrate dehydratase [Proteobacteria bacterium]|nr:NAD(P)H-hydrate dehydratase [Pseudomonadota bacterium]
MPIEPVFPVRHVWPLHGVAATRRLEQAGLAATPPHVLMQRAGVATARLALAVAPHARRVWIAAGPGNNGGDGLAAAIHLKQAGKDVRVSHLSGKRLPDDAADALARAQTAGVAIDASSCPRLGADDIALDALLGIGATRAPDGALAEAVRQLNALPCAVLAIDAPTGLDVDTGQPLGDVAVQARHTLSLLTLKPGLFTAAGRDHAGMVWLDTLGIDASTAAPDARLGGDTEAPQPRRHAQHKGSFGDVAIVGGAPGMTGAALLAARAAHAAGSGRTYVDLLGASADAAGIDIVHPELMFRPGWWQGDAQRLAAATVACGCGGGDAVRQALPPLIAHAGRLVIDADGLNAIAGDTMLQQVLQARGKRGAPTVLTPHPLEAARLLGSDTRAVQADRLRAARALAERYGAVVVLKGSGSVIAAPDAVPCINATGNASLGSAGTGDVLAGWLAGLWSQAHGDDGATACDVAVRAVALHGAAADPARPGPMRAADLVEALHRRLRGGNA